MNQAAKQKWVAALRSGEFKQGHAYLQVPHTPNLCCLGVACQVARREGVAVSMSRGELGGGNLSSSQLAVMEWLGLTERQESQLTMRNDSGRWPFERIADYIEKGIK